MSNAKSSRVPVEELSPSLRPPPGSPVIYGPFSRYPLLGDTTEEIAEALLGGVRAATRPGSLLRPRCRQFDVWREFAALELSPAAHNALAQVEHLLTGVFKPASRRRCARPVPQTDRAGNFLMPLR